MDGNMTPADIMAMTKDNDGMANIWNNPWQMYSFCIVVQLYRIYKGTLSSDT